MKKCLIISTVSRQFTLFERGNIEVLKELGYEIHCVANFEDETEEINQLGIIKHNIDIQRSPFSLKNIKAYKQLKQIINSDKYELIHCHSPMGGVLTRLAARKTRKVNNTRVLYTAHGFHFYKGAPLLNWTLYYPIEKWLSKYTDCLITINKEDYDIANRKFRAKKVELINGIGVDENKFNFKMSEYEKSKLRESLGLKDDDYVLIQIGELNKNKNQLMSINAMKEVIKDNQHIHLLLVGKGKLEELYKQKIEKYNLNKNIHFLGYRQDIPKLIKISNVLLSLSYREGLPVNVIEGMCCNIPIISTDCRGNKDLIEDGLNGYMVPINDIQKLKEKILYLINNKINVRNDIDKYTKRAIKEKMKIIYNNIFNINIIHLLSSNTFSGAENVVCQIIKMFDSEKIRMIYCSPDGEIRKKLKNEKIEYIGIKKISYKNVKKIIKKYNPNIIHAHDIKASIIASFFSKRCKIISHIHKNDPYMNKLSIKSFLFNHASHKINKIICVSSSVFDEYYFKNNISKKKIILNNYIDRNEVINKSNEYKIEKNYDVFFFGRLSAEKNPIDFIEIINRLNQKNIKCIMIGDGPLYDECMKKIKLYNLQKNIEMVGFKENPFPYVKKSKIGIITSKYEGFGLTAIESMILGKPILHSGVGGLKEIFNNNDFLCTTIDEYVWRYSSIVDKKIDVEMLDTITNKYTNKDKWFETIYNIYNNI